MTAPAGGEILYLVIHFADRQHAPLSPTFDKDFFGGCQWITALSGGRTRWTGTVQQVTLPGNFYDYDQHEYGGTEVNRRAMYDALIALLDLKNRVGLHRCVIDISGYGWQMSSGEAMWGDTIDPTSVYGSFANSGNFVHELMHTYYLGHYGFCDVPIDPDAAIPLGTMGNEIMGIGEPVYSMCFLNQMQLGWRTPDQLIIAPAWGGTFNISASDVAANALVGVQIPLTEAGAAYIIERRAGMVLTTLKMPKPMFNTRMGSFSVLQLPLPQTYQYPLIADTYRGITAMATLGATSTTIKVTTPVAPPAPDPVPVPTPTPTPTPTPMKQKHGHGRG